jgi:methionine-rich copper-binding protein CopC
MRRSLVLGLVLAGLWTGAAEAHARLIQATPRAGASVAAPAGLRLLFSETIVPARSSVTLTGPGGAAAPLGPLALDPKDPRIVLVPIRGRLAPGGYHVSWRMRTPDTHTTEGDFAFKVK